jgi:putative ABC transport system permease protein
VQVATEVRQEIGRAAGSGKNISGIDPALITTGYAFDWTEGSDATLRELGRNGAIVWEDFADDESLAVGDTFTVEAPGGKEATLEVKGIVDPPPFYPLLGAVTIPKATFDSIFEERRNRFTFLQVAGGPTEANEDAVDAAVREYPDARVQTRQEWIDKEDREFQQFLSMLYVLLALSVIVSVAGIINTLVLAVFERTRELGMLRAVGMTRRQVRRMIRHESVITALIGAALGLPLGIFLGGLIIQALGQYEVQFKIPLGQLITFAVVAVVVGILAAILPARRAARLNVLRALQYE